MGHAGDPSGGSDGPLEAKGVMPRPGRAEPLPRLPVGLQVLLGAALVLSFGTIIFPWIGLSWLLVLLGGGAAAYSRTTGGGFRAWLHVIDSTLNRGEQGLIASALAIMASVVFLDVVWRTATSLDTASMARFGVGLFVLIIAASFTVRGYRPTLFNRLLAIAAVYGAIVGFVALVCTVERGFGWSQRLALVLIIWVGLLGGSMAARQGRHIKVDAFRRLVPARFEPIFVALSGMLTSGTCAFLAVIGAMYCRGNFDDWALAGGRAFTFESLPIPYWGATMAMPVGFGLMAARFFGQTVSALCRPGRFEREAEPTRPGETS